MSTENSAVTPKWSSGSDSPIDTNNKALRVTIPAGDATSSYYAEAYSNKSLVINKNVANVKNLSFDFDKTLHNGGGSPHIIVIFKNGDVAYLASSGCTNNIGASSTWARADFTGSKTNCKFYVSGATGNAGAPYVADGAQSAWQVYATANPDQVVSYTDLVFDEPGDYALDRISLGAGVMYNYANTLGVQCYNNESTC